MKHKSCLFHDVELHEMSKVGTLKTEDCAYSVDAADDSLGCSNTMASYMSNMC